MKADVMRYISRMAYTGETLEETIARIKNKRLARGAGLKRPNNRRPEKI
jgi:hypothetical protein